MTLCGTCRFWDHEMAAKDAERRPGFSDHRISRCRWGDDFKLPEWCDGFRGMRFTNEAGTTERGCAAWEARALE
jgi:hypothetical protein